MIAGIVILTLMLLKIGVAVLLMRKADADRRNGSTPDATQTQKEVRQDILPTNLYYFMP